MMLLVSGKHRSIYDAYDVGHLQCPRSRNRIWSRRWAADNAAFSRFDEVAYVRMLDSLVGVPDCLFVTAPDVVGDSDRTLLLWRRWYPELERRGLPAAFVLQDGCAPGDVPWSEASAVFVGGTTDYKLGEDARECVAAAKRRGVWVHMGRVSSKRRLRYAMQIGCDSVDSSGFSRWPDAMFPRYASVVSQPSLLAS